MKNFNVILSISVSIPCEAENETSAIEKVHEAVSCSDAETLNSIREALLYSINHNDCIEVTDAVEIEE